ncbi:MAG: fatty acid cis/trans isomerase [Psychromonas sp.]
MIPPISDIGPAEASTGWSVSGVTHCFFAVRRTNPDFWQVSDLLHETQQQQQPINYGLLDYNRLDNR